MSDIVGYDIVFRTPSDFALDAKRRRWLESPEGQWILAKARISDDRLHRAAMVCSEDYRRVQTVIEDALKGVVSGDLGEVIGAESAIRAYYATKQA